jgi:TolB protein
VSPDGRRVLYSRGPWLKVEAFTAALDGSGEARLTDGTGVAWTLSWSPDGRRIAYTGRTPDGILQVFVMNADGSGARQVTHLEPAQGQAQVPAWSPDGKQLAFQATSQELHRGHLWVLDLDSGLARELAHHDQPYADEVPAWFPDGRRLAYQSDASGRMEVWVMNADGSGRRQLTH